MSEEKGADRRKFIRIKADLPVTYKFIALDPRKKVDDESHEGFTHDLSQGGLLLIGKLPILDWISPLLMSRMVVGISMLVPGQKNPVKALCRTAWVEAVEEKSKRAAFGLLFSEMTEADRECILHYVIRSQI